MCNKNVCFFENRNNMQIECAYVCVRVACVHEKGERISDSAGPDFRGKSPTTDRNQISRCGGKRKTPRRLLIPVACTAHE